MALRNIYMTVKASEEYIGMLEEEMTEEEYELAFERYEEQSSFEDREPRIISSSEIAIESKVVLEALGQRLGSDELARILNLRVLEVERALKEHQVVIKSRELKCQSQRESD